LTPGGRGAITAPAKECPLNPEALAGR
jgi:hypothetical protein